MKRRTIIAAHEAGLAQVLDSTLGVSGAQVRALITGGAVYVDGRRVVDPARRVPRGAKVSAVLEEGGQRSTAPVERPALALEVLAEDDEVLVVNKPAGVTAQPTRGRVGDSLVDHATAYLGRPAGLVHRLDRDTSGVTVFGKTPTATARLAAAFRDGTARKRYLAVTGPGLPPEGVIDLPLSKDPSRPGRWRATKAANGVPARTRYRRLSAGEVCVVELFPETGRTHQLRAHLAAIGFPIVGDRLYGGAEGPRCLLHAQALEIEGRRFEAPAPSDLRRFLTAELTE